jgi:hypothetical protein
MLAKPSWWAAVFEVNGKRWEMSIPAFDETMARKLLDERLKDHKGQKVKLIEFKKEPDK